MPSKESSSANWLLVTLPWVVVAIVGVLAYVAISHINNLTFKEPNEKSPQFISATAFMECLSNLPPGKAVTPEDEKSCLTKASVPQAFTDAVKPRIDELKWILTVIASIGVFFAIAQGAAAWFAAEVYTKRAESALKEISGLQDKISDTQKEIKQSYPLFEQVEKIRNDAFAALNRALTATSKAPADSQAGNTEALDWEDNLFRGHLKVPARQQLLSVESFASIDLHPGPFTREEHADMLRKFALFYRSKFLYEKATMAGSFSDLERAEGYLLLAKDKQHDDFTIRNDLASLYGTMIREVKEGHKNDYLQKCESEFRASLEMEPDQQRPHHGLAVIAGKYRKNYEDAIREIQKALDIKVWQRKPSEYMRSYMQYNLACYRSQLLYRQSDKKTKLTVEDAKDILCALKEVTNPQSICTFVKKDFTDPPPDGDFTGLLEVADSDLRAALETFRHDACEVPANVAPKTEAPQEPPKLGAALFEAGKLISAAFKRAWT